MIFVKPNVRKCGCGRNLRDQRSLCDSCSASDRICTCGKDIRDTHPQCTTCRAKIDRECSCGQTFTSHKTHCRRCADREYRKLKHSAETSGRISGKTYAEIRTSGPCVYCGNPAQHLDRVLPWSKGGIEHVSNLVPACQHCNLSKGSHLLTDWLPDKVAYGVAHSAVVAAEYERLMSVSV